jgi:hypothetical protein
VEFYGSALMLLAAWLKRYDYVEMTAVVFD